MYETLDISFGPDRAPIRFTGGGDANAIGFHVTKWEGWSDGVDLEVDEIKIPGSDGFYDLPGTLSSRSPLIEGYAIAKTLGDLGMMRDHLTSLVGGPLERLTVTEFKATRFAMAKVTRAPKFSPQGEFPECTFSLPLYCPKPQQFGDENSKTVPAGEVLTARNRGNREGTATLTVTGNFPNGYTINGPDGKKIVVTRPVINPHVIDLANRVIRINGEVIEGGVTMFNSWTLPRWSRTNMTLVSVGGSGTFGYRGRNTFA
jgi:hypothetical protein